MKVTRTTTDLRTRSSRVPSHGGGEGWMKYLLHVVLICLFAAPLLLRRSFQDRHAWESRKHVGHEEGWLHHEDRSMAETSCTMGEWWPWQSSHSSSHIPLWHSVSHIPLWHMMTAALSRSSNSFFSDDDCNIFKVIIFFCTRWRLRHLHCLSATTDTLS